MELTPVEIQRRNITFFPIVVLRYLYKRVDTVTRVRRGSDLEQYSRVYREEAAKAFQLKDLELS